MVTTDCSLPIQIVIITADQVLRTALRARLHPDHDLAVVGEADDVPGGRTLIDRLGATVLLVDGDVPDGAGLPLVEELSMRDPPIPSIVLTEQVGSKGLLFAALKHRAAGYAGKAVDGATLGDLVRRVASGERPIDDLVFRGCAMPGARTRRAPAARNVRRLTASVDTRVVAGANDFAFALFTALRGVSGNLLVSPFSIMQTLAMTLAGACGETADQMADILGCALPHSELHAALGDLQTSLLARGNGEDGLDPDQPALGLSIANALWGEQTYPFRPAYGALLEQAYGAGLHQTDFVGAPDAARAQINTWGAEQTRDRIREVVPPGAITADTGLVLANAIWFADDWEDPFDAFYTRDDAFYLSDGDTITVPFMAREGNVPYARGDGFQAIELAYAESGFGFTVILPDAGHFDMVAGSLTASLFSAAVAQLVPTQVRLALPKFEFESGMEVTPALHTMGMRDAFDPGRADFSGMLDGAPPAPLCISDVLHKAYVRIDEQGTEAAAVTVMVTTLGFSFPEPEPIEICIDRPFLFAIRDTQTGVVLFLGRVLNPRF
jgi:serpin B